MISATCFATWWHPSCAARAAVVAKAAAILRARIDEFARPVTLEKGKLIAQALGEVALGADILNYSADNAETFLARRRLEPGSDEAVVESSPVGVLFGVRPWNFPCYQLARFAAPNLMAGNVVMIKHAGCVPQGAIAFENLCSSFAAWICAHEPHPGAENQGLEAATHAFPDPSSNATLSVWPVPHTPDPQQSR